MLIGQKLLNIKYASTKACYAKQEPNSAARSQYGYHTMPMFQLVKSGSNHGGEKVLCWDIEVGFV